MPGRRPRTAPRRGRRSPASGWRRQQRAPRPTGRRTPPPPRRAGRRRGRPPRPSRCGVAPGAGRGRRPTRPACTKRSHFRRARPSSTRITATISETTRPSCSWRAGGGRMMTAGIVSTGSASSMPVVSRPMLPIAAATAPGACPARTSIEACTTLPAAAPPGRTRPAALPASWELPAVDQDTPGRVIRTRNHKLTQLPASSRTRTTNHSGRTVRSWGHSPNSATTLGATTYSPTPVTSRPRARPLQRRTEGFTPPWPPRADWARRRCRAARRRRARRSGRRRAGASQNSHSWPRASAPANNAGPVERAGFTEVFVTGMLTRWIRVSDKPMASGANPRGARVSVEPRITSRKNAVRTTSVSAAESRS